MIDRADLPDDADLASFAGRIGRRDEFLAGLHDWAATRRTEEIIEYAAALRIPVAAVATPHTVSTIDHFVARGVFREAPTGALHPRAAYHTREVLMGLLGKTDEEMYAMETDGMTGSRPAGL